MGKTNGGFMGWRGLVLLLGAVSFFLFGCEGDPKFGIDTPKNWDKGQTSESRLGTLNGKTFILRQAVFRSVESSNRGKILEIRLFDRVHEDPCGDLAPIEGMDIRFSVLSVTNRFQNFSEAQPIFLYDENSGRSVHLRLGFGGRVLLGSISSEQARGSFQVRHNNNNLSGDFPARACPD